MPVNWRSEVQSRELHFTNMEHYLENIGVLILGDFKHVCCPSGSSFIIDFIDIVHSFNPVVLKLFVSCPPLASKSSSPSDSSRSGFHIYQSLTTQAIEVKQKIQVSKITLLASEPIWVFMPQHESYLCNLRSAQHPWKLNKEV